MRKFYILSLVLLLSNTSLSAQITFKETDFTVAIFNYEKIEWAASTELGGNSKTSLNG